MKISLAWSAHINAAAAVTVNTTLAIASARAGATF